MITVDSTALMAIVLGEPEADACIVALTAEDELLISAVTPAYARWGKGVHPAALNFGDCFAYAVAREHGCRLLHVGADFRATDVAAVL